MYLGCFHFFATYSEGFGFYFRVFTINYYIHDYYGRWPEAEEIIKKYPRWAYLYAIDIIKGKWLEAEETIKKDIVYWNYCTKYLEMNEIYPSDFEIPD